MMNNNEQVNEINTTTEATARPLGRVTARELSTEEIASVAGGWSWGWSNFGGVGDRDMLN